MTARSSHRAPAAPSHEGGGAHAKVLHGGRPAEPPEAEALLVALTLSPATYSRNRFFEMYRSPDVKHARRRAVQLRGVIAALASEAKAATTGRLLSLDASEDGGAVLVYEVPALGMRRTMRLHELELSLLRYCVGRGRGEGAPRELLADHADLERIGEALRKLSPILPAPAPSNEV